MVVTTGTLVGLVLFFDLLLLTAAASKAAAGDFPVRLASQGIPEKFTVALARSVIAAEIAVSIGLASFVELRVSFAALATLVALFLGFRVWLWLRGSEMACNCFGGVDRRASNATDVAAASVYLVGAVLGLVLSFHASYYSPALRCAVGGSVFLIAAGLARGAYAVHRQNTELRQHALEAVDDARPLAPDSELLTM